MADSSGATRKQTALPMPRREPLPRWALGAACVGNCAHFYSVCSLFSYAGVMSADLGWAADRDHAGNIAGFLQTANVLGRMPTSSLWGYFAERYGLKLGVCIAMSSLALGNLLFGFCTDSVVAAVGARFLFLGMGSGWTTFVGPMALAMGGTERQTEVMGKIFASGTFIQLLGPAVGGWTYGWFPRFPAAVPAMLGSVLGLSAFLAVWRWMPALDRRPCPAARGPGSSEARIMTVICNWPAPLLILLRCMQGFCNFAFFEVVPLWAISSTKFGGLALSEDALGVVLATSAVLSGIFMAFLLQRVNTCLGLIPAAVMANLVLCFAFVALPACPNAVVLAAVHATANSAFGTLAADYIAFLNNTTPDEKRPTVNGVAVMFESFAKGVGPLLGAVSFAGSLSQWGKAGHYAIFLLLGAVHLLLALATACLPSAVTGTSGTVRHEKLRSSPKAASPSPLGGPAPKTFGARGSAASAAERAGFGLDEAEEAAEAGDAVTATCSMDALVHTGKGGPPKTQKEQKTQRPKARTAPLELEPLQDGAANR